jgi:hypothetical protein
VPFLPGAFASRLTHHPLEWTTATLERSAKPEAVTVPAGRFEVDVYRVTTEGRTGRFDIERAYPHRIVRWSWTGDGRDGGITESGELTGTARLKYWELHRNGDETRRRALGLDPVH